MSLSNFEVISQLGKGSFGSVFKVRRKSDQKIYAMKKVKIDDLSEKERENAWNEIRILASISNPNIVSYKEAFYSEETNALYLIMEYWDDGDWEGKIQSNSKTNKHFPETEIWRIFKQIVLGLRSWHSLNIIHRDLKSANVFITKNKTCKLGDLNVSKVNKYGLVNTQTGTPYYACPEIWKDLPYSYKSDIWSLGCVWYEMCTFKPPFIGSNFEAVFNKLSAGKYPPISNYYSNSLKTVIGYLLKNNPQDRPSTDVIWSWWETVPIKNYFKDENKVNEDWCDSTKTGFHNIMINTLKIPKKMKDWNKLLPKSNYTNTVAEQTLHSRLNNSISEDESNHHWSKSNSTNNGKKWKGKIKNIKPWDPLDKYKLNKRRLVPFCKSKATNNTNHNNGNNNYTNNINTKTKELPLITSPSHPKYPNWILPTHQQYLNNVPNRNSENNNNTNNDIKHRQAMSRNFSYVNHIQISPNNSNNNSNPQNNSSMISNKSNSNSGIDLIQFTEAEEIKGIKQWRLKKLHKRMLSAAILNTDCNILNNQKHLQSNHNDIILPSLSNQCWTKEKQCKLRKDNSDSYLSTNITGGNTNHNNNNNNNNNINNYSYNISNSNNSYCSSGKKFEFVMKNCQLYKDPISVIPEYSH